MVAAVLHLIARSWQYFLASIGTTSSGFVSPIIISILGIILSLFIIRRKHGKDGLMQHIRDNVKTTALVATAVFLMVYGLQFAWATFSTVLADHKSLLARIRLLHNETENLKHSVETWKQPASVSGGPVGPIAAVEIVDLFRKLPQPCLVSVTYHDDTKEFGETLKWILTQPQGASCKEDQQPNEPINVDTQGETPIPTNESGIVFHSKQTFAAGNELAQTLYRSGYRIVMSHKMPPNSPDNLVWLDIGHGSPWRLK